ncbi:complement C1q-like protein 3 [Sinocyclocheilus rhinocerous]|uniref:Complement C1q-like protein 3 n=1 Tax=Sinocyclocheilus rhinocerous TaxID=307959 RepID=A0A673J697_9TELE|nr:PREDICTED: complement C1q-like protein 3 [Sinocyclocheilus rhinocerous]
MKMLAAQKTLLLLCVGVSLAHDFITSEQFKNIEERLRATEETLNELKRENEALRTITKASRDELESIQAENKAKKVAFSAGLLASGSQQFGPFDTRKTLVYQKIFTNTGNAYDPNTGTFTAPVNGVYFFRFYAHAHPFNQMAVSLHKNNQLQCSVFVLKPETNVNGSNGVVLSLQKGDEVCTQLWENSWVFDDESSYTSFSGFLLFSL